MMDSETRSDSVPTCTMRSTTRQAKLTGNGQEYPVSSHWLAKSTGTTPVSCIMRNGGDTKQASMTRHDSSAQHDLHASEQRG